MAALCVALSSKSRAMAHCAHFVSKLRPKRPARLRGGHLIHQMKMAIMRSANIVQQKKTHELKQLTQSKHSATKHGIVQSIVAPVNLMVGCCEP